MSWLIPTHPPNTSRLWSYDGFISPGTFLAFSSSPFSPLSGGSFPSAGEVQLCQILACLQSSGRSPHCSLCLQPRSGADGEIGNQRPVLLESLSWLQDAKRCYQLINTQPASFLHDKTSSIQQGRLQSIRNEEIITPSTYSLPVCHHTSLLASTLLPVRHLMVLSPLLHNAMWGMLTPCPLGCSHRRELLSCQLPAGAECSCCCLCHGVDVGVGELLPLTVHTRTGSIPSSSFPSLLSSFLFFYVLSFISSLLQSLPPTLLPSSFLGLHIYT